MPELRSRARDTDFSLIDLPRTEPIDDPPAYLQAAVRWHLNPETGSPYWLKRAKALDFNPLTDVTTFEDLALFPNVVDELRDVDVRDRNGYRQSVFRANTLSHPDDLRAAVAVVELCREIGTPRRFVRSLGAKSRRAT